MAQLSWFRKKCECESCKDSEDPCRFDCDMDDLCDGCRDAIEEEKDREFEILKAKGML